MPNRSQRHLREQYGLDSAGDTEGTGGGPGGIQSINLSGLIVPESAASGSSVGTLSVINGVGTYVFTILADPDNKFAIDGTTLETDQLLNFEADSQHPVTIQADNGVDAVLIETFIIVISNVIEDQVPDNFTFASINDAQLNTLYESDTITVLGMEPQAVVAGTVSGVEYSKNGGSYSATAFTAQINDTFKVRRLSSGANSTAVFGSLTIGGVVGTFTITTEALGAGDAPSAPIATWTTGPTVPVPTFGLQLNTPTPTANDEVHYQVGQDNTFAVTLFDAVDILSAGEISGAALAPLIGPLPDGVNYARFRWRTGVEWSDWSNIISQTINTYQGLGAVRPGALGMWGLRAYSAAQIGVDCVRVRRATDNVEQTFQIQPGGYLNYDALLAFRDAAGTSTLYITTLFDQIGNCDLVQATQSKQPELDLVEFGDLGIPTMKFVRLANQSLAGAASGIVSAQPYHQLAVGKRTGSVTQFQCYVALSSSAGTPALSRLASNNSAGFQGMYNGSGVSLIQAAGDNIWHVFQGTFNNTASRNNIDGAADVNGTTSPNTLVSGTVRVGGLTDGTEHLEGGLLETAVWSGDPGTTQRGNIAADCFGAWRF